MKLRLTAPLSIFLAGVLVFSAAVAYAVSNGRIDPNNKGQHYASFLTNPGVDVQTNDLRINFGKFSTQADRNIRITDAGFTGYAWGAISGWIVMNCSDTASGCSASNGNFKVVADEGGMLGGYAWGENTGWINFGPFTNPDISRVQIDDDGYFDGEFGAAGYAWSENFGWIFFDCESGDASCVRTDYEPSGIRSGGGGGGSSGSVTQCGDNYDNDGDGYMDMEDPQCGNGSTSEFAPYVPPAGQPVIPGPVVPTTPPYQPTWPGTPTTPGTPATPGAIDPGEGSVFVPVPDDNEPDTIIGEVVPIVTDVVTGESTPSEAWGRLKEMLRQLIQWIKDLFDMIASAVEQLMGNARVRGFMGELSVFGLALLIAAAILLAAIVPIAAGADLFIYPRFVAHNIATALGIMPPVKPWGVVYDTATFVPLAFATVNLVDAAGKVVATTLSQPDGSFAFRTPPGTYTIAFANTAAALTIDPAAPNLFGPLYTPGEMIGVADNIPSHPFSIGVAAPAQPALSGLERFMINHEVLITNISLTLFGMGMLAAVLSVIFAPSALTVGMVVAYGAAIVLRGAGAIGSYASIFIDRITKLPAAGKLVQVYDAQTKTEVARTLTSRLGRAYFNIPKGHYYNVVSDPRAAGTPGAGTTTAPYIAHGGLHRAHIEI